MNQKLFQLCLLHTQKYFFLNHHSCSRLEISLTIIGMKETHSFSPQMQFSRTTKRSPLHIVSNSFFHSKNVENFFFRPITKHTIGEKKQMKMIFLNSGENLKLVSKQPEIFFQSLCMISNNHENMYFKQLSVSEKASKYFKKSSLGG